jgi:hypothetical protein
MLTMELNNDAFHIVGRFIPALIVVLAMLVRLANEARQQRRLAKNFNIYTVHNNYTKGEK